MVCGLVCVAPVPVRLRGDILRVQNAIATAPGAQLQVRHRIVRLPADDEDETVRRVCCYLYVLLSLRRSSLMVPRMNYILKLTEPSMVPHANRSFEKSVARAAATRVFRFTSCAFLILCNKYLAHGSCLFK